MRRIICFLTHLVSHFLCDAVQESSVSVVRLVWGGGGRGRITCYLTYLVSHFLCDAVQESSVSAVKGVGGVGGGGGLLVT